MEVLSSLVPFINIIWYIIITIIVISFTIGIKKNKFGNLTKDSAELTKKVNTIENDIINIQGKIKIFEKFEKSIETLKISSNFYDTQILLMKNQCTNKCELVENNIKYINDEIENIKKELISLNNELKDQNNKLLIAQYEIVNNIKDTMKEALNDVIKKEKQDK